MWPNHVHPDRTLAAAIFSVAGLLVWGGFVVVTGIQEMPKWLLYGGAASAIGGTCIVGASMAPRLARHARSGATIWSGAVAGGCVALASYAMGATLLSLSVNVSGIFMDANYTAARAVEGFIFLFMVAFARAIIYIGPGVLVGAIAGIVFYRLARSNSEYNE